MLGKLDELVGGKINTGCGTTVMSTPSRGTTEVDLREIVNHNGNGGSIHDLLEETKDRLSVITHSESEVALDISINLVSLINHNVPGQMTIEWVAPASAASLVSSMVVAADPPGGQLRARSRIRFN